MAFNRKAHLISNIQAIKIAFDLEKSKRQATEEEIKCLKIYSGFGGIKCILNPLDRPETWSNSDKELYPYVKELIRIIEENVGPNKLKAYYDSLKTAFLAVFIRQVKLPIPLHYNLKMQESLQIHF